MADSVRFIFTSLIKVPVAITIIYIIINVANFTVNYVRLYSLSQVAVNTAMENNFIPQNEFATLLDYAESITTRIMNDVSISVETPEGLIEQNRRFGEALNAVPVTEDLRVQYGSDVTVEINGSFLWMLPIPIYGGSEGQFGLLSNGVSGMSTDAPASVVNNQAAMEAEMRRRGLVDIGEADDAFRSNITFRTTVPGLKYYPDIDAS